MLDHLDCKDDCYSLGVLSKLVSHELNSMQATKLRRKVDFFRGELAELIKLF